MERVSFKKRFGSPAALALFGAFAVPEPFGTIVLAYAAVWWWQSRRNQKAQLTGDDAPLFAANMIQRVAD